MRTRPAGRLTSTPASPVGISPGSAYLVSYDENDTEVTRHIDLEEGDAQPYAGFTITQSGLYVCDATVLFVTQGVGSDPGSGQTTLIRRRGVSTDKVLGLQSGEHPGWPVGTSNSPQLSNHVGSCGPVACEVGDRLRVNVRSSVATSWYFAQFGCRWVDHLE